MPHDPGSPVSWMHYAQSDLQLAHTGNHPGVLYETLCFHAQQAVEKAIKAVLIAHQIPAPKVHSIEYLISYLPATVHKSFVLTEAAILTDYAVIYRYPGDADPVTEDEYRQALRIADEIVHWAESVLAKIARESDADA